MKSPGCQMPTLKVVWTKPAEQQFDQVRQRAVEANCQKELSEAHTELAKTLRDLDLALEKGDPIYNTKMPGGIVYHFRSSFLSVTCAIFAKEGVGWIVTYRTVPTSWPDA